MPKKRVVLFLVEGVNDKTALAVPLEKLITTENIKFDITDKNGDITSRYSEKSIAARVGDCVKKHCEEYKYKREDFAEVVLLIDMDGAYINAEAILKDESCIDPYYNSHNILYWHPDRLYESHIMKQQNLNRLVSLPYVLKTIPFSVYFFSSNLDHVIVEMRNENAEK